MLKGFYDKAFVQASHCFFAIEFLAAMQLNIESDQLFKMSSVDGRKSSANVSESNKYHQISALRLILQRKAVAMRKVQRIQI